MDPSGFRLPRLTHGLLGHSLMAFLSPCRPRAAPGPGLRMEPFCRRPCPGPQRPSGLADPSRPRFKDPPPGFSPWALTRGERALGGLVCREAPAARPALGAAGRGGCLGAEGRGRATTAGGGVQGRGSHLCHWKFGSGAGSFWTALGFVRSGRAFLEMKRCFCPSLQNCLFPSPAVV